MYITLCVNHLKLNFLPSPYIWPTLPQLRRYYYPRFTDDKSEAHILKISPNSHSKWWNLDLNSKQFNFRACEIKPKLLKAIPGLMSLVIFVSKCEEFLLGGIYPRSSIHTFFFYCSLILETYFTLSHTGTESKVSGNNTCLYNICCVLIFYILFHFILYKCCLWLINGSWSAICETQEIIFRSLDPFLTKRQYY